MDRELNKISIFLQIKFTIIISIFFTNLNIVEASCSDISSLAGCTFSVNRAPLSNLIPIPSGGSSTNNILTAPSLAQYKNGSVKVISPYTLNRMEGYKVVIVGDGKTLNSPNIGFGEYFLPKDAMTTFLQTRTSSIAVQTFGTVESQLSAILQCKLSSGFVPIAQEANEATPAQERSEEQVREDIREQRRQINRSPEAVREREQERQRGIEQGSVRPASGATTSTADGSGLINMREDDPNSGNETPGCEILRNSSEENGDDLNEENLTQCLSNIRAKLFEGLPNNLSNTVENRNTVFTRMVSLTNEEQEFVGGIFTVKGEANESNPIEGAMVLKVLSNRRNNANELESQIRECEESGASIEEIQECHGRVNEQGKYNLLDIAIDPMQFSMYNTPNLEGNWNTTIGPSASDSSFSNSIKSFLFYSKMEDVNISGGNSNSDIDQVYHYNTTSQYNSLGQNNPWNSRTPALDLSVEVDGETYSTSVHKFYYNVDAHGSPAADGWHWNVRSEFKDL